MSMYGVKRLFCDCSRDKGRVKQQARPECDINAMVARARNGAMVPMRKGAFYFDCTTVPSSYQEAQEFFLDVDRRFDRLPADVRLKFDNQPSKLVKFVEDASNIEECRKLGLLPPTPPAIKPPEDKPAAPKPEGR